MIGVVTNNLICLTKILEYNVEHGLLFFRITSDIIPFASHPVCKFNWMKKFREEFEHIGNFIKRNNIRISMHPGQYVLQNALNENIRFKSIDDLLNRCDVL
jgi:UV DNA damage endonuclease